MRVLPSLPWPQPLRVRVAAVLALGAIGLWALANVAGTLAGLAHALGFVR